MADKFINIGGHKVTVQNIFPTDHNVTNCITAIPQDINLTLSSGTLTSPKGTKVWYPYGTSAPTLPIGSSLNGGTITAISWDGAKLFYQVSLPLITQTSFGSLTSDIFLLARNTGTYFEYAQPNTITSGTTPPSSGVFYNTSTNIISYYDSGSISRTGISLPIALCHRTSGVMDKINQILNGMGYIGSTLFALSGVKVLAPNGRNADGSLKNNLCVFDKVTTVSFSNSDNGMKVAFTGTNNNLGLGTDGVMTYDESINYQVASGASYSRAIIAKMTVTTGVISNLKPKTVFHAVDWNDVMKGSGVVHKITTLNTGFTGTVYWCVTNGFCTVTVDAVKASATTQEQIICTVPKTKMPVYTSGNKGTVSGVAVSSDLIYIRSGETNLLINPTTTTSNYYGYITYPVADDWVES